MADPQHWPEELDALIAAPRHHRLLMENDTVRMIETHVPAGETVPLHTHRWPCALYVLSWSDCLRRDPEGHITSDSRQGNMAEHYAGWSGPLPPHTLENIGPNEIRVIHVEMKHVP